MQVRAACSSGWDGKEAKHGVEAAVAVDRISLSTLDQSRNSRRINAHRMDNRERQTD